MAEQFITIQGKKELEAQLFSLKKEMEEIIKKIKEARDFGDISENAEYDAAKNEQAQLDAKILEIEQTLRVSKVVDDSKLSRDIVQLGSTVRVMDYEFNEELTYKIVGSAESDVSKNKISDLSPTGAALLGKKKGDVVIVKAPQGEIKLKIIKIS